MPKQKTIFLFAFANDKEGSLRLADEERAAREALTAPHISPSIEYMNLGNTSLDDIYYTFTRYHNRIALFHFGGHSDDQLLSLTDTHARSSSLSTLMGMQENLQLVFLNGCNNDGQVKELQSKQVKAVIATSVKINDERALQFCQKFYQALTASGEERQTIRQAFDTAKSYMENAAPKTGTTNRDLATSSEEEETDKSFEWELYLLDGQTADWAIPGPPQQPKDADFFKEVMLTHDDQNKLLLELAFGIGEDEKLGLSQYISGLEGHVQQYDKDPDNSENMDALRDKLFEAFPSVLSIQLKDLFTYPEGVTHGRLRLSEINEAYLTLGRLLNSIALSTLWEAALDPTTLEPRKDFIIREEYKKDIQRFLQPGDPASVGNVDYFWLVGAVNRIFQEPENKKFIPYVPELANLFQSLDDDTPYFEAYRFLEQNLRHRLIANDIASEEVKELCRDGEGYLGLLLQKCAFLSNYQLVTVKDVTVYQPRQQPAPVYYHHQFTLQGLEASNQANIYTPLDRAAAINNNSIYLAKDFRQDERPLNLTPFLIDENAFKTKLEVQLPKIHFFNGREGENTLQYVHAEVPQTTVVIRKSISERDAKFKRKASSVEKYGFEYYTDESNERKKMKNLDAQNYKQKELKILFEQLELFKKAIGI